MFRKDRTFFQTEENVIKQKTIKRAENHLKITKHTGYMEDKNVYTLWFGQPKGGGGDAFNVREMELVGL